MAFGRAAYISNRAPVRVVCIMNMCVYLHIFICRSNSNNSKLAQHLLQSLRENVLRPARQMLLQCCLANAPEAQQSAPKVKQHPHKHTDMHTNTYSTGCSPSLSLSLSLSVSLSLGTQCKVTNSKVESFSEIT